jgi:pimeloyl-ACP methyl ester carboxylesterase
MLHFESLGEGQTTWVFLHGFLESSSMWRYLDLSKLNGRKILIDLPGHGLSALEAGFESPSIHFMAQEVETVLEFLEVDSCQLVGHSMGGYVGIEVMRRKFVKVRKMVFLNSNCWADNEQKKKDRERVAQIAFKAKHIFIQEAIPNLFGTTENFQSDISQLKSEALKLTSASIAYAALAMKERKDYTSWVQETPDKFLFIHGELDRLVATQELIERVFPAEVKVIPEAGHMAHIEHSMTVTELLAEFGN